MIKLFPSGVYLINGVELCTEQAEAARRTWAPVCKEEAAKGTIAYRIIQAHNTSGDDYRLSLKFDSLTSHDITYVGIIQTARASGMDRFPVPYVMTNCHNSLCAVGGTINEDDHMFALSAARKYGGIYVPANLANIHSYNREMMAGCGRMILGSDSHTRYGALGCMGVGEGGGELAKQMVGRGYDFARPEVICVYLNGKPRPGVGPHDVALSIIGAVYKNGYVKNKVMEFVGPGVDNLPIEYRNGIDVMTTETTCWSSVWITDDETKKYYGIHGRKSDYKPLKPADVAYYDGCVYVDLDTVECTIAMPMHPSNTYTIRELNENAADILHAVETEINAGTATAHIDLMSKLTPDGRVRVDQGIIAGCSGGTFDSICAAADILRGRHSGNGVFDLSIYPDSMPTYLELVKNGRLSQLIQAGAVIRECCCGPCFGAGDTPANGELSIRHTTRNFPFREGSKPGEGQLSAVALMDARSIAATAANGGIITPATELGIDYTAPGYYFDPEIYEKRVYFGWGKAEPEQELRFGPNIKDWPEMPTMSGDLLVRLCAHITDPVTTTDELIPSGETSSFRSNPERLAEFALSRREPDYVPRSKAVRETDRSRARGEELPEEYRKVYEALEAAGVPCDAAGTNIVSGIFANMPGDGSAREQAASCQRVLGGGANFARQYATKRYRSNCINWGIVPFILPEPYTLEPDSFVFVPGIKKAIRENASEIKAFAVSGEEVRELMLSVGELSRTERRILAEGCLINYYRNDKSRPND